MSWLSRLGNLLDEIDSAPPDGPGAAAAAASGSDASPAVGSSGDGDSFDALGTAFGRGFGRLTSAAAAAGSVAAKATAAAADGAKGQFGGVTSTLTSFLRDDAEAEDDAGSTSPRPANVPTSVESATVADTATAATSGGKPSSGDSGAVPNGGRNTDAVVTGSAVERSPIARSASPPSSAPPSSRGLAADGWSLAELPQQPAEATVTPEGPTPTASGAVGAGGDTTPAPTGVSNGRGEEMPRPDAASAVVSDAWRASEFDEVAPPAVPRVVVNGDGVASYGDAFRPDVAQPTATLVSAVGDSVGRVGDWDVGDSGLVDFPDSLAPTAGASASTANPVAEESREREPVVDSMASSVSGVAFGDWSALMGTIAAVAGPGDVRVESVEDVAGKPPPDSFAEAPHIRGSQSAPACEGEPQLHVVPSMPGLEGYEDWQLGGVGATTLRHEAGAVFGEQTLPDVPGPPVKDWMELGGSRAPGEAGGPEAPKELVVDAGRTVADPRVGAALSYDGAEGASAGEAAGTASIEGAARPAARAAVGGLEARARGAVRELEAQLGRQSVQFEAQLATARREASEQLAAARRDTSELQRRLQAAEEDGGRKVQQIMRLTAQLEESSAAVGEATAASGGLEKQVDELRRELAQVKMKAKAQAAEEHDSTLSRVREEMEQELSTLLKKKDDQLRALESKLSTAEKTLRELTRELDHERGEADAMRDEMARLKADGVGRLSDSQREFDRMRADFEARVAELERKLEIEERQKHELALNIRSVEERARNETAQLEVEKSHFEVQVANLQAQLQEEQQRRAELSIAVGEAQHRVAELEGRGVLGEGSAEESEVARRIAEEEARELRERVRSAEEKLLDSQSMRDMFAKETDMYRSELRVAREERGRLEEDLTKAQERLRESQAARAQADLTGAQQGVLEAMQKDFEGRMERYRDEVQYLRQKCDEKERRCEQLLAERASLQGELRNAGGGSATAWRSPEPDLAAVGDIEVGAKKGAPGGSRAPPVRSMPLAHPAWVRHADEPLKMVVRTLADMPQARLAFFAYVLLLHVWVLFILQQSAVH